MRRVQALGISCVTRGIFGALAVSSSEASNADVTVGWRIEFSDQTTVEAFMMNAPECQSGQTELSKAQRTRQATFVTLRENLKLKSKQIHFPGHTRCGRAKRADLSNG